MPSWTRLQIRERAFDQANYAPSQATDAVQRVNRFIARGVNRVVNDAPFLFVQNLTVQVEPKQESGANGALQPTDDPWVLRSVNTTATSGVTWNDVRDWDARTILIQRHSDSADETYYRFQIREVWTSGGYAYVSLEKPWPYGSDTSMAWVIVSDPYLFPKEVVEVLSMTLRRQDTSHQAIEIVGQGLAEEVDYFGPSYDFQAGTPQLAYRRPSQHLQPPRVAPTVATDNGDTWDGPEASGTFQYVVTLVRGRRNDLVHGQPTAQNGLALTDNRLPAWIESAASPESAEVTSVASGVRIALTNLPNVDHVLGFDDAGVDRYRRGGFRKRIYRRRVSSDTAGQHPDDNYYLLDEVDGHVTSYFDDGSITPDWSQPLRQVHGYQAFSLWPVPAELSVLTVRAVVMPNELNDDADVTEIPAVAAELIIQRVLAHIYEMEGNQTARQQAERAYELALHAAKKRLGSLRPPGVPGERTVASPRRRGSRRRRRGGPRYSVTLS